MKKRVFMIAALVSGALAVSGCTTNPYTGEREAGKSGKILIFKVYIKTG
jgi:outer membrane murein-binding lipoprotein Lpp